jgi:DNA gyrase subunit B
LITALGTGIGQGEGEFDIAKLRYHKVVIMTDADVDGAHIRTLLLTFFFRKMPEIIQRGNLYIAQPPLYKVKKGKSEFYVKDDKSLQNYLIEECLENSNLVSKSGTNVSVTDSKRLILQMQKWSNVFRALSRKGDSRVLMNLLLEGFIKEDVLKSQPALQKAADSVGEFLSLHYPNGSGSIEQELIEDPEHSGYYRLILKTVFEGARFRTEFNKELLDNPDIAEILRLSSFVAELGGRPFNLKTGDRNKIFDSPEKLVSTILESGKEKLSIQRYKGLGEMNPEQLWETTMDPKQRTLLQVSVDDAAGADAIFSVLMGDNVEPRRDFIEKNALRVRNLDI